MTFDEYKKKIIRDYAFKQSRLDAVFKGYKLQSPFINASNVMVDEARVMDGSAAGAYITTDFDYLLDTQDEYIAKNKPQFLSATPEMLPEIQSSDYNGFTEIDMGAGGYSPYMLKKTLDDARWVFVKKLGIKLPPYVSGEQFRLASKIANEYDVDYINCGQGYGLKLAVENVKKFRENLDPDIAIIGSGGICDTASAIAHIKAGADLMAVGSHLFENNQKERAFEALNRGLERRLCYDKMDTINELRK